MNIPGCQMLVCTRKLKMRIFDSSLHLLQIIAYYSVFLKYSSSKSTVLRSELVDLTCSETISIFHSTPKYQLSVLLLLCLKQESFIALLSLRKPSQVITKVAQEPDLGARRAMILLESQCLAPEVLVKQLVGVIEQNQATRTAGRLEVHFSIQNIFVRHCADKYIDHKFY